MISTKCDKCKNKAWCWSCDECQSKPLSCFVCDEIITYRERHNHMSKNYNDPDQYLTCHKCKVNELKNMQRNIISMKLVPRSTKWFHQSMKLVSKSKFSPFKMLLAFPLLL